MQEKQPYASFLSLTTLYNNLRKKLPVPSNKIEDIFYTICILFTMLSIFLIAMLPFPICIDIIGRTWFGVALDGVIELETLSLVIIAFSTMPYIAASGTNITIDLLVEKMQFQSRKRLVLFGYILCLSITAMLGYFSMTEGAKSTARTAVFLLQEGWFIVFTGISLLCVALAFVFRIITILKEMINKKDYWGICFAILFAFAILLIPIFYRYFEISISKLVIGTLGFVVLFSLMLLGVPIGFSMCLVGIVGLFCIQRTTAGAISMVAQVPFRETANFVLVAAPMFMLMGELTSVSSISKDLFDCANKWLGRKPGGLACSTIVGCAGFGAICGDSLATVVTMSSVALPQMLENKYHPSLACGTLAAGGTLAILIPPSMGFIFYSIMTEESVGQLFIAGIIPGILLASIFIGIIIFQVKRNPELAPPSQEYTLKEKIRSLTGLLPMTLIFILVIGGILKGIFTPGEGGAVGALGAFIYAVVKKQINIQSLFHCLMSTALMTARIFVILVGVYVLGSFLSASRLPTLLANFIIELEANKYVILLLITVIYLVLGCLMNILPMMLLTLPAIYPTVQALGFDGIWFGVFTVILMECGMITPPVGMNVFTLASLAPNIPMISIFKGAMPFFLGMLLCVLIITIFPALATWLPAVLL